MVITIYHPKNKEGEMMSKDDLGTIFVLKILVNSFLRWAIDCYPKYKHSRTNTAIF